MVNRKSEYTKLSISYSQSIFFVFHLIFRLLWSI